MLQIPLIPDVKYNKPSSCKGCDLDPLSEGFMKPQLATAPDRYKVALVGEALGEDEVKEGGPFVGRAGFRLNRLLEWAGLDRSKFDIWNAAWCRPPNNKLEGEWYEKGAVSSCKASNWGSLVSRANVVVPMGNVALSGFTGRKGILSVRGYILEGLPGVHLLPTVHPSFIQRGMSKYSAAFIHDVQKAVELASKGMQFQVNDFLLDPSPLVAYDWAKRYRDFCQTSPVPVRLAYDIETPGKGDDEGDLESEDDGDIISDRTYFIWRIGFSYAERSALSIPWTPEYIPAIRILLEGTGEKVVWNGGFDNPRIRYNGVDINGVIHDGMVAWHILHSDLPKGLGFVATFTCPYQPMWKHLSTKAPAFYNATDAVVEWEAFKVIEKELKATGLWDVYQSDVLDLEPILIHMTSKGMPIDADIRYERAVELDKRQKAVLREMVSLIPSEARIIDHVFVNRPKSIDGLEVRVGTRSIPYCPTCGAERPRKEHFKRFVKKVNPCADGEPVFRTVEVEEYYRLAEWKPSRSQLMRYQEVLNRPIPTTFDNKTKTRKKSMGEKQIKELQKKYKGDKLYPLILTYRELDKVAGTYIGRPIEEVDPS